ncbi:MAG: hypothetical protein KGD63_04865 [Candidatus Lokiarchaeota archaeon]|nr:hypothetical protein [Candidatus Lokiarchaeota archaeon]
MEENTINEEQKIAEFKKKIAHLEHKEIPKISTKINPKINYHNFKKFTIILFCVSSIILFIFGTVGIMSYYFPGATIEIFGESVSRTAFYSLLIGVGIFFLITLILLLITLFKKSPEEILREQKRIEERKKKSDEYIEKIDDLLNKFSD